MYIYIYIYIYSPSSRLGLIITNDNHKLKNEDNVKNQLERSHKGMQDTQTKRRYTIHKHIYDILNYQGKV